MLRWMITLVCVSVAVAQEWELVWSDEFDGPEIDDTKWTAITSAAGFGVSEQFILARNSRAGEHFQ